MWQHDSVGVAHYIMGRSDVTGAPSDAPDDAVHKSFLSALATDPFMHECVQVSPAKALQVVAGLLDLEAPGEYLARFVSDVILSMRSLIPVETLCAEVRRPATRASVLCFKHSSG